MTAACVTCEDYQFVDVDGQHEKESCPDCGNRRCPIHGQIVAVRGGTLVGKCWDCGHDAARGLAWMRSHPYRRKVAA